MWKSSRQGSFKTRFIVKGYAHKPRIDFDEIFSLVVQLAAIQVALAIAVGIDLELKQMDVKMTFLHGDIEKEIYILQFESFVKRRKENLVCRLNKSLYGLKKYQEVGTSDLIPSL
uniref:Reverse transcriptase Ty1/copia-type domain-containing protein n=1 Tax=Ananas comosus var. bracteatus TaxID=296719 RepID=A0A6V7PYE9_ANACO|nr:unnamed protein product [Ananas comosus var. bracteatus]